MSDAREIESAVRRVTDQTSFIQELLIDALGWPIDVNATEVEEITFGWAADELQAVGLDKHIVYGTIRQLQPISGNPWGIFLLDFKNHDLFTRNQGMTGTLRRVLRGLVPTKKKSSNLASFQRKNLLFICHDGCEHFRFAHFKTPAKQERAEPLAVFGWGPGDPIRTLCEFNLKALAWPDNGGQEAWLESWAEAFDVEKVTQRFYRDYAEVFSRAEARIGKSCTLAGDQLRMFTQLLLNRLLFIRLIERKQWLNFADRHDYLKALFEAHPVKNKSLFAGRLRPLFFEGLAIEGKQESMAYGKVPFLNGGLFEPTELDIQVEDIRDDVFEPIIGGDGLFYRYNFTVEESTPLEIEVAVDPEMLGKVFEELVTGRHDSGSYYTPRPVVSFMCREALKGVLIGKTGASEKAITLLVDDHSIGRLSHSHAQKIVKVLDNLKAVDPACGSGAYLLGLLHEMIAIYTELFNEKLKTDARSLYKLKLDIITNNLYGADIDRCATNIAMLRLWLSLVVEADVALPLPNLDFKIETGDSLLAPNPQVDDVQRMRLRNVADLLVTAKNQYVKAQGDQKVQLHTHIQDTEETLAAELEQPYGDNVVDWRIRFAEVFASSRNGFDIVLANPPYVRKEQIPAQAKQALRREYDSATTGQSDLYCYFYSRGLQLLANGGMHVFVCSNSWLDSGYGAKLQRHLLSTAHIQAIYDCAVERQFATADVNTIISVIRKGRPRGSSISRFVLFLSRFDDATRDLKFQRTTSVTHHELWKSGLRINSDGHSPEYRGNKWGGKYLRSPAIYEVILERAGRALQPLGKLADIQGYVHDNNTGGNFPLRSFLKTVKHTDCIKVTRASPGVQRYGVKQQGNSALIAPILFPRTFGERHLVVWNVGEVFGKEFYKIIPLDREKTVSFVAQLNSTFGMLQREILGLVNLGDGAIKFSADDIALFDVNPALESKTFQSAFEHMASRELYPMEEELRQDDRRKVDSILFESLELTAAEQEQVYCATIELVQNRIRKAKSRKHPA